MDTSIPYLGLRRSHRLCSSLAPMVRKHRSSHRESHPYTFENSNGETHQFIPLKNVWPDLSFCSEFRACTNLQAMIAFGWLGWITLSVLMLFTVVTVFRTLAWREHVHGEWSDRPLVSSSKNFAPPSRSSGGPTMNQV